MANKLNLITQMYEQTLIDITKSSNNWLSFLKSATWNFGYNFSDKVCIYKQRPDAKACASIDDWNNKTKRWINSNAKGIALIREHNGTIGLKYIFDISDTHKYNNKDYNLWSVKKEQYNDIIEALENKFGTLETKESFVKAIYSVACISVNDNIQDYLIDLKDNIENSALESLDDILIDTKLRTLLNNSVTYMMLERCNVNPLDYFISEDFKDIVYFNTYNTIIRLGEATSDIAEAGIIEIKRTIQILEKNNKKINRTFANNNQVIYSNNNGRSDDYGNNIYETRRLSNTKSNIGEEKQGNNTWQIRNNEIKLSERAQENTISSTSNERPINRTFNGDSRNSDQTSRNNIERISKTRADNRENEKRKPNELGNQNEQSKNYSRGNSNEGSNLQLESNIILEPVVTDFPTEQQQIENIQNAEVENTSAFVFSQEIIDSCLRQGSHFEEGKFRIYKQLQTSLSSKENIDFLKHEYGIGGCSSVLAGSGVGEEHDSKGITLYKGFGENAPKKLLTWKKVEERLKELIALDRYFNEKEKDEYLEWLEKEESKKVSLDETDSSNINNNIETKVSLQETLVKEFDDFCMEYDIFEGYTERPDDERIRELEEGILNVDYLTNMVDYLGEVMYAEDEDFEFTSRIDYFIEQFQDRINALEIEYDFRLVDRVYIGVDEYEISFLGENQVTLFDPKFPLLSKVMDRADFEKKVKENPTNSHLIKNNRASEVVNDNVVQSKTLENQSNFENNNMEIIEITDDLVSNDEMNNSIEVSENTENESELQDITSLNLAKTTQRVNSSILNPEIIIENRNQYKITNDNIGVGTPKEKYRKNVTAITILKKCEDENRLATKAEQEELANYVGWGGLSEAFDENNSSWQNEYNELKNILTEEEYEQARASTLTAFYTPPVVIRNIYRAIENMGFKEGNILEPACGTGHFIGMMPELLNNSKVYGIELDSITGRIARQLYQKSTITIDGYENTDLPDSFFDIAVGNVPFGDFKITDKRYDKNNFLIHDYFFRKNTRQSKTRRNNCIYYK